MESTIEDGNLLSEYNIVLKNGADSKVKLSGGAYRSNLVARSSQKGFPRQSLTQIAAS